jgi:WD40 repeat protein
VGTIKGFVYLYNADLTQINKISNSDVKVTSLFFD